MYLLCFYRLHDKITLFSREAVVIMLDHMENIKIVSSLRRPARPYVKVPFRKTHSLFIRVRGSMEYSFPDQKLTVPEGNLVFIPKGSCYEARLLSGADPLYMAIHFVADSTEPLKPFCCSLGDFPDREYLINCFADMWSFGTPAEKYKCYSLFYSLLYYLSEQTRSAENSKYSLIDPAIAYLKEHMYDCGLKTDRLHRLCGISGTYFRELFAARFGTTPHSYLLSRRLSYAMSILRSGDFHSIGEVAQATGFSDPLYFSKLFKKAYGVPPSDLRKL